MIFRIFERGAYFSTKDADRQIPFKNIYIENIGISALSKHKGEIISYVDNIIRL